MPDTSTSRFGALLRRHRLAAGLSQAELAERAGLSPDSVGALESGRRANPRPYTVRVLADALSLAEDDRLRLIATAQAAPESSAAPTIAVVRAEGEWGRLISPPRPPTRLIGREREVAEIAFALRSGRTRLMTLTGPGGVGKTRLAVAAAEAIAEVFPAGVAWVELAHVIGPAQDHASLVAGAIARALGIKEPAPRAMAASLAAAIGSRTMALVLDNFEHLIRAAPLVAEVLASCPELVVLVTSRESLRLRGEREYAVHPLAVPDQDGVAAVRLFAERAVEVRGDFALTEANTPAVATLCRQLDGLLLAIELAVPWVKVLSPEALTERLTPRLALLARGAGDLPDRQQTMRDTIAWSYELLCPDEQRLFRRLSVFAGGFTLDAAEAVGGDALTVSGGILSLVAALVDKSLVRPMTPQTSATVVRFGMLETIREFALERLLASGEEADVYDAHAAHFVDLVTTLIPTPGGERPDWLERLAPEAPNLRGALTHLVERGQGEPALRLAEAWQFLSWSSRADSGEAPRWLEAALALDDGGEARIHALIAASGLAALRGDHPRAATLAKEGLAISLSRDYPFGVAYALFYLGVTAEWSGDLEDAAARYEEAVAGWQVLDEPYWVALAQTNLGIVRLWLGDAAGAEALVAEGLAGSRSVSDPWGTALGIGALATVTLERGEFSQAMQLYAESLALWSSIGDQRGVAGVLAGLAGVAIAGGEYERAAHLLGVAAALGETVQAAYLVHHEEYRRVLAATRAGLSAAAFDAAWSAGHALDAAAVAALVAEIAPADERTLL
jgi:predicted ATPase/transcriptional regulator with XRE-family HTH domain